MPSNTKATNLEIPRYGGVTISPCPRCSESQRISLLEAQVKGLPPNQDPLEGEHGEDLIVDLSRTQLLRQSLKAQKFAELRSLWKHLRRHVVDLSQRISLLEAQVKGLPPKQEPLEGDNGEDLVIELSRTQ